MRDSTFHDPTRIKKPNKSLEIFSKKYNLYLDRNIGAVLKGKKKENKHGNVNDDTNSKGRTFLIGFCKKEVKYITWIS
jgi:hypothetical protein